jgi:hypothetical protein
VLYVSGHFRSFSGVRTSSDRRIRGISSMGS